jgi:hypothetical protein
VISSGTVQGYRNDSTWARGQAWALHGFTQAYAYTGDDRMLTTARSAADYFIGHLPADGVPLLGTATLQPNRDGVGAGTASAFRTVPTATGSIAKLNVYLDSANRATRLVAGVYASAGSHPGRLLTQATLTSVTSGAWNALTVPKASVASGTTYWIAVLSPSGRGTLQIRDKFGGGRSETSSQGALTALPQTWTTGHTWPDGPLSATGGRALARPPA